MANTCEGEHYECGQVRNWPTGETSGSHLAHNRDVLITLTLGDAVIKIVEHKRTFSIDVQEGWELTGDKFVMSNGMGGYFTCAVEESINQHSISENHSYTTTKLSFLDARYNNAIGKEVIESQTFSYSGSDTAEFREEMGNVNFPKFKIINHQITRTTNYFIILNGIRTVLLTETESWIEHGAENPLIIIWPLPPSLATPIDADVLEYGFYDYYGGEPGESQVKIRHDGGDDFYYTDWMRLIGQLNQDADQQDADNRYFAFYLHDTPPYAQAIFQPEVFHEASPLASIAQDAAGNVFYSATMDGHTFNGLTNGDLAALFPEFVSNPKFYPVSTI
jgi:hypothetical protein